MCNIVIKYKEHKQFRQAVKLINVLAFLPVNMIRKGISVLYETFNYNDDVDDILTYFNATYMNGIYKATTTAFGTTYLKRQPSIFPPHLWNVFNASKKGYARTNNIFEAFNNKFKNIVRIKHPNIYIFIDSIQIINSTTMISLTKNLMMMFF
ncbi:uncharacterized protein LOC132925165 [Rhopalosiphum padi]|uniref:uncharacterized protein LOC132925165 n=1 Tax=Rhopalosiphum padi TaxID=40932 RepID=UPI00298DAE36|nr:uncharacterized protein LOC132925165 [Rhopalosiphum padi]